MCGLGATEPPQNLLQHGLGHHRCHDVIQLVATGKFESTMRFLSKWKKSARSNRTQHTERFTAIQEADDRILAVSTFGNVAPVPVVIIESSGRCRRVRSIGHEHQLNVVSVVLGDQGPTVCGA